MRSTWKGVFQPLKLLYKISQEVVDTIKIYNRSCFINSFLVGRDIAIYNGRRFILVNPTEMHKKHLVGEFARTRAFFVPKAKKKKTKAKAKKKKSKVTAKAKPKKR
jgi:ribosomal protein S19